MFKSFQFIQAFYVLRVLAKIFPPLPYVETPYIVSLQNSSTFADFTNDFRRIIDEPDTGSSPFLEVKDNKFKAEKNSIDNLWNSRNKPVKGNTFRKFNSVAAEFAGSDEFKYLNSVENDDDLNEFCLCSKAKFLYYIAKFSAKLKKNKEEGLLAVMDFMELMELEKNRVKAQKMLEKAALITNELMALD